MSLSIYVINSTTIAANSGFAERLDAAKKNSAVVWITRVAIAVANHGKQLRSCRSCRPEGEVWLKAQFWPPNFSVPSLFFRFLGHFALPFQFQIISTFFVSTLQPYDHFNLLSSILYLFSVSSSVFRPFPVTSSAFWLLHWFFISASVPAISSSLRLFFTFCTLF